MVFLIHNEFLDLFSDIEDTNFTILITRDDFRAIHACSQSCDREFMSIVYNIEHFARLRQESPDFAICPPAHDAFTITHEINSFADL